MRALHVLLCTVALVWSGASSWAGAPVRVATNPSPGGGVLNGNVLLYPGGSAAQGVELWRTDGTVAGTQLVKDLVPGTAGSYPENFVLLGGVAYFTASVEFTNYALWRSDGTAGGTYKVADLPSVPDLLQVAGPAIYFNVVGSSDISVWRSDGTPTGTARLKGGFDNYAGEFTPAAGKVFFSADDGVHGEDLWVTDDTFEGTGLVRDINPGSSFGIARGLRAANGWLMFGGMDAVEGLRLWRSDGTAAGTQMVGGPRITGDMGPVMGSAVLLTAEDVDAGWELWRSDGTPGGSFRVSDLLPGASSQPRGFVGYGGLAYFTASVAGGAQTTAYRTDGTAAGTAAMAMPLPSGASVLRVLGGAGEEIFLLVQEGAATRSIWGADRNLRVARKRFELTSANDDYFMFTVAPGGLYFSVERRAAATTTELWFMASESPAVDSDFDGVPDGVEPGEGLNPQVKDNDVFTSARLFAMQQYRDFLGREGDADGINYYAQQIGAGSMTRAQAIEVFLASPEFQGGLPQCTRLYFSFFGRIPDFPGLLFQVGQFRTGVPLDVIAQNFSNSPEFTNRYGALDNDQYINLVYQNVLGRAPDPGGYDYYKTRLDNGTLTRGAMMIGFSESPEFQQLVADEVFVVATYVGTLRRMPEQSGMDFYVDRMAAGVTRNEIISAFIGSPEYRTRFLP